MKVIFFADNQEMINKVYGDRRQRLESLCDCYQSILDGKSLDLHRKAVDECEVIFSTWSMPVLDNQQVGRMRNLKALFYAAGSVQYFARPFLDAGIRIFSSWKANAIPVAEFTVAQIILALKQAHRCSAAIRSQATSSIALPDIKGIYGATVGIVSLGVIGRLVCEFLKTLKVRVIAFDPFVNAQVFNDAGAQPVDLDTIFRESNIVSIHTPELPSTKGMISYQHLINLKPNAAIINTSRASIINQEDLLAILRKRNDLTAILDLIDENQASAKEIIHLPNAFVTPHIAGSMGDECLRMADAAIQAFIDWRDGKMPDGEVTMKMLETMA